MIQLSDCHKEYHLNIQKKKKKTSWVAFALFPGPSIWWLTANPQIQWGTAAQTERGSSYPTCHPAAITRARSAWAQHSTLLLVHFHKSSWAGSRRTAPQKGFQVHSPSAWDWALGFQSAAGIARWHSNPQWWPQQLAQGHGNSGTAASPETGETVLVLEDDGNYLQLLTASKTYSASSSVLPIRPQMLFNACKRYNFEQRGKPKHLLLNNGIYSSLSLALLVN